MGLESTGKVSWTRDEFIKHTEPKIVNSRSSVDTVTMGEMIKDKQQFIGRFKWSLDKGGSGLDIGFNELMLEEFLYDYGWLGVSIVEPGVLDFSKVGLTDGIDRYGRMRAGIPIFPSGEKFVELSGISISKDIKYRVSGIDLSGMVLLNDYTVSRGRYPIARCVVNNNLIRIMNDLMNYMQVSSVNSLGIQVYSVDEGQLEATREQLSIRLSELRDGVPFQLVSKVGSGVENLTKQATFTGQNLMQMYQSVNNIRLGFLGITNTGTFNKKERKLEAESDVENSNSDLVLENYLAERKLFCELVNSTFGVNFSCELKEVEYEEISTVSGSLSDVPSVQSTDE